MRKKIISFILCIVMCLSILPAGVFAGSDPNDYETTDDIGRLITDVEIVGVEKSSDGTYFVNSNKPYSIKLTFDENDSLEMDMTGSVHFTLPEGVVASGESNTVNIGIFDGVTTHTIEHAFSLNGNVATITWNKNNEYFEDLKRAHYVHFSFTINSTFDGSKDEVTFGTDNDILIKVDTSGDIVVTKSVTGLKADADMNDAAKSQMTFDLYRGTEKVKTFSYAEMNSKGSITFEEMKPGNYVVVETGHPVFAGYTFDISDSVTQAGGTLANGGVLNLALKNDYEHETGSLQLNKSIACTNWDGSHTVPSSVAEGISFKITGPNGYSKTFKYSESFENGVLLLDKLDIGTYTITETNTVKGYTWTYKVNNADAEKPSAEAAVEKDKTTEVDFDNTYVEHTADLTIRKTVSGGASIPQETTFRVTYPEGIVLPDGTNCMTFRYKDMENGVYVLKDVPLGTYKVEEIINTAQVDSYALNVSMTENGTVEVTKTGDNTVDIENVYSPLGSLKISKIVAGDLPEGRPTDDEKKAIVFNVYNSKDEVVGSFTYLDLLEGKDTLTDLPIGMYRVVETAPVIEGYTMTSDPEDRTCSVQVIVGSTATAAFTNTYRKDEYKITVAKVFKQGSCYDASSLPDTIREKTKFTVSKGGTTVATCYFDDLETVLNGLILDGPGTYKITETNPKVAGLGITAEYSVDGGKTFKSGSSVSVSPENHVPLTVVFRNNYTPQGTIKGDKTVLGAPLYEAEDLRTRLTFSIYRLEDTTYVQYRQGVTLAQLEAGIIVPAGRYYVQEAGSAGITGYWGPVVYTSVEDGEMTENSNTDNFTVSSGTETMVHFTNIYATGDGHGKLELIKYVRGLDAIGSDNEIQLTEDFEVKNTRGDFLYEGISIKIEERVAASWKECGTYPLETLLNGGVSLRPGHYRMTELYGDVDGYSLYVDFLVSSSTEEEVKQTAYNQVEFDIDSTGTLKVELHNVYTKLGNLKITKTVTGDMVSVYKTKLTEAQRKAIVFEVKGPFGFHETFTFNDICDSTYTYGEKVFSQVPVGTYTVTETANNLSNFNITRTCSDADGELLVDIGKTSQIDFTNQYDRMLGNLTITKVMTGEVPSQLSEAEKQAMVFHVTSGSTEKYTVSYDLFNENGTYTFYNVPTGSYKVTETIGAALADNYLIDVTQNGQTVSVSSGKTGSATIINNFTRTGTLVLVKDFAGFDIPKTAKDTVTFTYWMIDDNNEKIEGTEKSVQYGSFVNGSYTVKNLAPGKYVVAEEDDTTGYKRVTTVQVDEGEAKNASAGTARIEFGKTSTVRFGNTYSEVATITISKTVSGALKAADLSDDQKKAISYTVTDSNNGVIASFTYFEMESGTRVIKDLVPGDYTVTETVTDPDGTLFGDYTCGTSYKVNAGAAVNGMSVTFHAGHGGNTVAFTNKYTKIDPLKVEKVSSDSYVGLAEIDGVKYPVWRFTLSISNLNPLTTRNGSTVFTDTFDDVHEGWFRLATEEEVNHALNTPDGSTAVEPNAYIRSLENGKPAPNAEFDTYDSTIIITGIDDTTAEKCEFIYYLIVKDKDTLKLLNTPKEYGDNGAEHSFRNTVTYHPMPNRTDTEQDDAAYKYEYTAVNKGIINIDSAGTLYELIDGEKVTVNYALYSLTLNPDGITLGDTPTITATDTFSGNQSVVLSSIRTTPGAPDVKFVLKPEENKIEFYIPNGTPVSVTYRVNILDAKEAKVRLSNKLELCGFNTTVDVEAMRSQGGEGVGETFALTLVKVDELNNNIKLKGVTFSLYDADTDELLTTAETDARGQIAFKFWGDNGAFKVEHDYYMIETKTITGYSLDSTRIYFRFSKTESPGLNEGGVYILRNGGELVIKNEPVATHFEVTKSFNDWTKQSSFTFKLKPVNDAPMPAVDTAVALKDDPDTEVNESIAEFGLIRFDVCDADFKDGKSVEYDYIIQELVSDSARVPGITYDTKEYPVKVTITDNNGVKSIDVSYDGKESLIVTNRYSEGSLKISKTLLGNDIDPAKEFKFTIKLDASVTGTFSGVEFKNGKAEIVLKGGDSKTISGIPNGIHYEVTEADYSNEGYKLTSQEGNIGEISDKTIAEAKFTNVRDTFGDLEVTKTVTGNAGDEDKAFEFTVTLTDKTISGTYGGMEFKDGIAVFTLKHGETKTAEGLPNGTGYTVTEKSYTAEKYETTSTGATGTVNDESRSVAAFTNERNATGDLSIAKTIEGNDKITDEEFTFTITLDPAITGTFSGVEFKNGVGIVVLKGGESKLIKGLPNRTKYEVTEAKSETGYVITYSEGTVGTISETKAAEVKFTNTRDTYGDLEVTKTVTGNAGDNTKAFEFTVTLTDKTINGTYGEMEFKDGTAVFTLKHGETKTATDLPNGTGYTITEKSYAAEKYETSSTGATGTINDEAKSVAAFTNERNATGDLSIAKTIEGNDKITDEEFTFTITLDPAITGTFSGVEFKNGVGTVVLKGGESKLITGLPNGTKYEVTEAVSETGYVLTYSEGTVGTISETKAAEVKFTNTRDTFGDLKVSKTVTGNGGDKDKAFEFTVELTDKTITGTYGDMEFKDGIAVFTLKDSQTKTATGLPNGTGYTVTEKSYADEDYTTSSKGATGTIKDEAVSTAAFTNTRLAYGGLTIQKILTGNDKDLTKEFIFDIELDAAVTGTFDGVEFKDGKATVVLTGGTSKTITGLPNRAEYTVTEREAGKDYELVQVSGNTGVISEEKAAVAVFTNNHDTYGDLEVSKTVTGNAGDNTKGFEFTVTLTDKTISGKYGEMEFKDGIAVFTLKHGETKTATGLPNGTGYTVTEKSYAAEKYETTSTGAAGTINDEARSVAAFTNERNATGDLSIEKTIEGNDRITDEEFTFTITLDPAVTGTFSGVEFKNGVGTVVLKGGESKVITGLPNRTKYEVTEAKSETGYVLTYSEGTVGTISETKAAEVKFTNTRDTYGDLEVTKTVTGNAGDNTKEFEFTVELTDKTITGTYGEMEFKDGIAVFTLKHGETKTATGLPNGTGYIVTEKSYTAEDYATSSTGAAGTINDEARSVAAFTNERNATGDLSIEKTIEGNDKITDEEFTFTITLDPAVTGTFSGVEFKDGVGTVVLKGGESKLITGLPNRTKYEVTEAKSETGYVLTYSEGTVGTISETKAAEVKFTNTRDTFGDLEVSKTVTGNAGDEDMDFEFTVELTDKTITGTYGEMEFKDGIAVFTLKHGETKTATDLPNGTGYTVTEKNYTDGGYETSGTGVTGTINDEAKSVAAFTNERNANGDLVISKTLEGNDIDPDKEFTFTIELDPAVTGIYSEVEFEDGIATIVLKGGESRTIEGLPNRTEYRVTEADYSDEGYEITYYANAAGTISETAPAEVKFTNTRNTYGDLVVTKTVSGKGADREKYFNFTVTLDDEDINGVYGDMEFVDGVAVFMLKDGESMTATGLPNGTEYTVAEDDYTEDGYTTTATGDEGTITDEEVAQADFINKVPPKTGYSSHLGLYCLLMFISVVTLAVITAYTKKRVGLR